jgi:hypothetical protein
MSNIDKVLGRAESFYERLLAAKDQPGGMTQDQRAWFETEYAMLHAQTLTTGEFSDTASFGELVEEPNAD